MSEGTALAFTPLAPFAPYIGRGFREKQKGRDHDYYFLEHDGLVKPVYTKVSRGRKYKNIGRPLIKKMSKQLHLSRDEFDNLINCPMTGERYREILVDRKVINYG